MKKEPNALYLFKDFNVEKKKANSIRAKHRLDCEYYLHKSDTSSISKKSVHPLYIYENNKRQIFLYQNPTTKVLNKRYSNSAEYCLIGNGMNLSSLYTEYEDESKQYAYGFPNKKDMNALLRESEYNPSYNYTNDGYIFIGTYRDDKLNRQFKYLEVFVFTQARDEIQNIYNLVIDGEYEESFNECRQKAQLYPFYTYNNTKTSTLFNDEEI